MADLELIHIRMFAEEGDPGWYAGQLDDGRRVHATRISCAPRELHWSGSVEDPTACECDGAGTCNLCLIRQDGGLVFTKVTGCYRSSNSAVRALKFWAAHPDAPQPPAPFNCGWTTMQATLCDNEPDAAPVPLGTTVNPILRSPDDNMYDYDPTDAFQELMIEQITPESLDECSEKGHPRQAWLILTEQQEDAEPCPACGHTPDFIEKMTSGDMGIEFDYIDERIDPTKRVIHEISVGEDRYDPTFYFSSDTYRSSVV